MPDDCGLKPPIDTFPQIAQERAMRVLGTSFRKKPGPVRLERGGMIAPDSRDPPHTV
jgi:hypothetical protein